MVTKEEHAVILSSRDNLQQRLSPDSIERASQSDRDGNAPIVPEKPSEDGFNWRKYGQKNVKGNEYIRSYYKCSYSTCLVKKQVERSPDGRITDITYLGKHDHPKPHSDPQAAVPSLLSIQVHLPDCPPPVVHDEKSPDEHATGPNNIHPIDACELPAVETTDDKMPASVAPSSQARDDYNESLTPKRRKKAVDGVDIAVEKSSHESRLVIHTVSEVDIVNDGYRRRKYGQKLVKGNPYPRSYYRCSTQGCPVKKHVERASHDPKVVITTYEGQHDHTMPPIRTIVPQNDVSESKSEESIAAHSNVITCKPEKSDNKEENAVIVVANEPQIVFERARKSV